MVRVKPQYRLTQLKLSKRYRMAIALSTFDEQATESAVFPSQLGWMAVQWQAGRLRRLVFGFLTPQSAVRQLGLPVPANVDGDSEKLESEFGKIVRRLQRFAEGQPDQFLDLELDLDDRTGFQRRVIEHCRRIPFGQTMTYGQLAARAGSPRAACAVGSVMATNRIPLIVPCHRVVSANSAWGGYSAPGGLRMKKRLLRLEGCRLDA